MLQYSIPSAHMHSFICPQCGLVRHVALMRNDSTILCLGCKNEHNVLDLKLRHKLMAHGATLREKVSKAVRPLAEATVAQFRMGVK